MSEKGYILFSCDWVEAEGPSADEIQELNQWRTRLYGLGLIGMYEDGIGFGNVSARVGKTEEFIISGTQTGGLSCLAAEHYARVTGYSLETNSVSCIGRVKASSESLSHAALYRCSAEVKAVVHVHHGELWKRLYGKVPTTGDNAPPGTPEIALEITRLFRTSDLEKSRVLVMGGHEEGLMSFGSDPAQAAQMMINAYGAEG